MTIYVINTDKLTFVGKFADEESANAATSSARYNPHFVEKPQHLDAFKATELVSIYNSLVDADKKVKRFASLGVAKDRTWGVLKSAENKPTRKVTSPGTRTRSKYDEAAIIRIPKEHQEECPRRKGEGHGGKNWELYRDGMTVGEYLEARKARDDISGTLNQHFYWDVNKGFITIESAK